MTIKTVIKRSGEKEEFQAEKLNQWGIWAAKTINPKYLDWGQIVMRAVSFLPDEVTTKQLQDTLIKTCVDMDTYESNLMAGRLYAASLPKEFYANRKYPHIKDLHQTLIEKGLIVKPNFTDEEYDEINKMLNHKRDLKAAYYSLKFVVDKYSMRDKVDDVYYETPQYTFMRVAMQTVNSYHGDDRMERLRKLYDFISLKKINVPTPYYANSLTGTASSASCAVLTCNDTAESIGVMNMLGYSLTVAGAGLGLHMKTRSINDPVKGGKILHLGKIPLLKGFTMGIKSMMQSSRGGSVTYYYPVIDPEIESLLVLKNPMTVESRRFRQSDYGVSLNKWFLKKAARKEMYPTFSYADNPELYEQFYSGDWEAFGEAADKFAAEHPDKVIMKNAYEILTSIHMEALETGRLYLHFVDEANRHTPFKEKIYSSNLCNEIALSTGGFDSLKDLYDENYNKPGVAFCNLAGINVSNIETDDEYADVAYYALFMIDRSIENTELPFPALNNSIRFYRSAGVGILGLAHLMAMKGQSYKTQEGRNFMHELAETHAWHLYNAALKMGKEFGNAGAMERTKFPEGWLPIDTYNKNVDELVTVENKRDWEQLRKDIVANKGIRFTTMVTHMPGESSANASQTTNGLYAIRQFSILKTSGNTSTRWAAPDSSRLKNKYEIGWDIPNKDLINMYSIFQKFCCQGISADLFVDRTDGKNVKMSDLIQETMWMAKYGMKGRYYYNSKIERDIDLGSTFDFSNVGKKAGEHLRQNTTDDNEPDTDDGSSGCAGGACTL